MIDNPKFLNWSSHGWKLLKRHQKSSFFPTLGWKTPLFFLTHEMTCYHFFRGKPLQPAVTRAQPRKVHHLLQGEARKHPYARSVLVRKIPWGWPPWRTGKRPTNRAPKTSHCQSHGFYRIYYLVLHSFLKKGRMIPTVVPTTCLWTFHHLGLMRKFGLGILW